MSRPPLSAILNPPETASTPKVKRARNIQEEAFAYAPTEKLDVIKTRSPAPKPASNAFTNLKVRKLRQRRRASDSEMLYSESAELLHRMTESSVSEKLSDVNNDRGSLDHETTPKPSRRIIEHQRSNNTQDSSSSIAKSFGNSSGNLGMSSRGGKPSSVAPTPIDLGFWNLSSLLSLSNGRSYKERPRSSSFGKMLDFQKQRKPRTGGEADHGFGSVSSVSTLKDDLDDPSDIDREGSGRRSASLVERGGVKRVDWRRIRTGIVSPLPDFKRKDGHEEPNGIYFNSQNTESSRNSYDDRLSSHEQQYGETNMELLQYSVPREHQLRSDLKSSSKRIISLFSKTKRQNRSFSRSGTANSDSLLSPHGSRSSNGYSGAHDLNGSSNRADGMQHTNFGQNVKTNYYSDEEMEEDV